MNQLRYRRKPFFEALSSISIKEEELLRAKSNGRGSKKVILK